MNNVHDIFQLDDFTDADVSAIADTWIEVGTYEVGVTEEIEIGYGVGDAESALGRIYFDPKNAADAALTGDLKIEITDKEGTVLKPRVIQMPSIAINSGATDYKSQMVLNQTNVIAKRERKIRLLFKCDTTDTLDAANSTLNMAVTRYNY